MSFQAGDIVRVRDGQGFSDSGRIVEVLEILDPENFKVQTLQHGPKQDANERRAEGVKYTFLSRQEWFEMVTPYKAIALGGKQELDYLQCITALEEQDLCKESC